MVVSGLAELELLLRPIEDRLETVVDVLLTDLGTCSAEQESSAAAAHRRAHRGRGQLDRGHEGSHRLLGCQIPLAALALSSARVARQV